MIHFSFSSTGFRNLSLLFLGSCIGFANLAITEEARNHSPSQNPQRFQAETTPSVKAKETPSDPISSLADAIARITPEAPEEAEDVRFLKEKFEKLIEEKRNMGESGKDETIQALHLKAEKLTRVTNKLLELRKLYSQRTAALRARKKTRPEIQNEFFELAGGKNELIPRRFRNSDNNDQLHAPKGYELTKADLISPWVKHYYFPKSQVLIPGVQKAAEATVEFDGVGTGFVIAKDGVIMTNQHVLDHLKAEGSVILNGTKYPLKNMKVLVTHEEGPDLAIIKIPELAAAGVEPIRLRDSPPRLGETVFTVGFPKQSLREALVSVGNVTKFRKREGTVTDAETHGGNSGGCLVDQQGQLVGMVHGVQESGFTQASYAVTFSEIRQALDKIKSLP